MTTYILKRLLLMPLMLLGITVFSFLMIVLAPGTQGGGSEDLRTGRITKQQLEVMQRTFHIGKPWYMRYLYWLGALQPERTPEEIREHAARGEKPPLRGILFLDFGQSVHTPSISVATKIKDALPVTIVISLICTFVIYSFAIPIGIYSATHHNTLPDRIVTVVLFMLWSLPSFWVAVLLISINLKFPEHLRLPIQGWLPSGAEELPTLTLLWKATLHLFLPVVASCYGGLAGISRYMRVGMLEVLRQDYIRTARAKGCGERTVIYKHALRNSLIPIITLLGGLLPGLIGGSFIIETIFGIPGMGYLGYTAVLNRDYTLLMAEFTLSGVLVLVGILISDILYVLVDPRISFEKGR